MPLDLQSTVYGAVYSRIVAGVAAYNAAAPGLGLKTVAALQQLDDRTNGRLRTNLTASAPVSYPKIRLKLAGGDRQKTSTPTFGLMQGAACDAIMPRKIVLVEEITFDPSVVGDEDQTPLEAYIDAAYEAQGYYKLGIAYCRGFAFTNITRKPEKIGVTVHLVRRKTISVDLRPHLATVQ